jgi:phosphoenolpyruvate-protein kinase (PTS system EI component)
MRHFPSDQDFAAFLLHSLGPARGHPISIRLLDTGADKRPVYLNLPIEPDPFLGRRWIRVLRQYPDLLEAQLRALLEISRQIPISVLIPMVTTEKDIVDVVEMLGNLADDMGTQELPGIGATIETPAATLSIPTLKQHVDFLSIGSNDLTQYTMAAGRENPLVSHYFIDSHPAVFRLIDLVVKEAGTTPVSICGELAGRLDTLSRLIASGIDTLSVPAAMVPDVKAAVSECRLCDVSGHPISTGF